MLDRFSGVLDRSFARYAIAVVVVAISLLLHSLLIHSIGLQLPPFTFLFPGVMLVAILAGLWPGILATVLAALATRYFFLPPFGPHPIARTSQLVAQTLFVLMGVLFSLFAERHLRNLRSIAAYRAEQARRLSEDKLHQASEYQSLALEAANLGAWALHMETGDVLWDDRCRNGYGFPSGHTVAYEDAIARILPEDRLAVDEAVKQAIAGVHDGAYHREYRVAWSDGSIHWIASHGRVYFEVEGDRKRPVRFIGVNADITESKQTEAALQENRAKLDVALASMTDALFISDAAGRFIQSNEAFLIFHRFHSKAESPSSLAAFQDILELSAPDGKVLPLDMWSIPRALRGESATNVEYRLRRKDTGETWIGSYSFNPLRDEQGVIVGAVVVARDITESKQDEQHIRSLNRIYTVLSDINQTIVREKDSQAMLEAACRIAIEKGQFRMAWVGMVNTETQFLDPVASSGAVEGYLDMVRIDFRESSPDAGPAARCFFTGRHAICNDIEHELRRPWLSDALRRGFRSSASFPLLRKGSVIGVFTLYAGELAFFDDDEIKLLDEMAMDISFALEVNRHETDRRKKEDELRWRTAFFEAQIDSSLDGVLVVDSQGAKILQNQRMIDLLKIPKEVAEDPDDARQLQFVHDLVKNPDQFEEKIKYLYSHPDQVSRDEVELLDGTIFDRYSAPVRDKAGKHYGRIWTFRDITQSRQLEAQLLQAQKMESVGQLTGGIAHDFNNLLTVILGCSEFLGEEVKDNPRLSKMAHLILDAAQRGADLTQRMLAFARRQALQPRAVDVNALLASLETLLRRALSADIDLKISPGTGVGNALVDPAQLESALLNLCVNARDAMPRGGKLTIETALTSLDEDYAAQNPEVTPGKYILVAVSDTGTGISSENLARIFDPFFTTKEVGKGTGLGLSMVHGFIKQSQGHIKPYSELGHGTSVKLYLPIADKESEPTRQESAFLADLHGSETIVLAEDNDSVREYATVLLTDLGYRVLPAANGRDALEIIRKHDDAEIDLLFTDVVMPGMNGRELSIEACKLNPRLKVLYCSGYAEQAILHQWLQDEDVHLLNKPYSRLEVARSVRAILNENQSAAAED